jgi:hypothetical protein
VYWYIYCDTQTTHRKTSLESSALGDLDASSRTVPEVSLLVLNHLNDLEGLRVEHLTEDNVLAIEPGAGDSGDEELGAVGVGACQTDMLVWL